MKANESESNKQNEALDHWGGGGAGERRISEGLQRFWTHVREVVERRDVTHGIRAQNNGNQLHQI
jgi:hypothetical protein